MILEDRLVTRVCTVTEGWSRKICRVEIECLQMTSEYELVGGERTVRKYNKFNYSYENAAIIVF